MNSSYLLSVHFSFFEYAIQPKKSRSRVFGIRQWPPVKSVAVVHIHGHHTKARFDEGCVISTVKDGGVGLLRKPIGPLFDSFLVQPWSAELFVSYFRWGKSKLFSNQIQNQNQNQNQIIGNCWNERRQLTRWLVETRGYPVSDTQEFQGNISWIMLLNDQAHTNFRFYF